jgi:hypothetical protein
MSVLAPTRSRRRWTRAASVLAMSAGLVLGGAGVAGVAYAYTDPNVSGCLNFVHTNHWYSTTQKVVGTNTCSVGPFRFQVLDWSPVIDDYSPCFSLNPGESAGWQWPRPGRPYEILSC